MRDLLTDAPRSAPVLPSDPEDVVGHIRPTTRSIPVAQMLQSLREMLHVQLDAGLDAMTTDPEGNPATVLEDLLVRQMAGYGVAVGLECRHPSADGRVEEDRAATGQPEGAALILGPHD